MGTLEAKTFGILCLNVNVCEAWPNLSIRQYFQ